jgi:chromatin remodeling complex protein RSC6
MSQKKTLENSTMTKKVQEKVQTENLSAPVAKKTSVKKELAATPAPAPTVVLAPVAAPTPVAEPKKVKAVKKELAATPTVVLAPVALDPFATPVATAEPKKAKAIKKDATIVSLATAPVALTTVAVEEPKKVKKAKSQEPKVEAVKLEDKPAEVAAEKSIELSEEHAGVQSIFESLLAHNEGILNTQKAIITNMKKVWKSYFKEMKEAQKNQARDKRRAKKDPLRKKREPSGFAVASNISTNLCQFLTLPSGSQLSRTDVTRKITSYIREQNLQVPTNRRSFTPDSKLALILGPIQEIDKEKGFTYFNLQRYITPHFNSSA